MSPSRCSAFVFLVVSSFVLLAVVATGQPDAPAKKPLSFEDEIRELKRRANDADAKFVQQTKEVEELRADLKAANEKLAKVVGGQLDKIVTQAAVDRVPLGAMIPYFGTELPKGYAWADGKSTWPREPWVPEHLRGQAVPNMSEQLVGGTNSENEVGAPHAGGSVTVTGTTIDGGTFSVPAAKQVRLQGEVDKGKHGPPHPNAWMILMENFEGVGNPFDTRVRKYPYVEWSHAADNSGWWHRVNLRPLNVPVVEGKTVGKHVIPDQKITLSQNGPFLMCRWIIRVQ